MDIALESLPDGVILPIRAQPGARRNAIVGMHNGRLKLAVTQVAEKGKANDAVLDVLVEALGLRASQVEVVAGLTNREKMVRIRGVDVEALRERIAAAFSR